MKILILHFLCLQMVCGNCIRFQVDKAFEHLVQYSNVPERNISFSVTSGEHARGICLRETYKISRPTEHLVSVEPIYLENNTGLLYICRNKRKGRIFSNCQLLKGHKFAL